MTEQDRYGKVINGLEEYIADLKPYCGNKADWKKVTDALGLLKEHEPIKPGKQVSGGYYYCANCGNLVYLKERFCAMCGHALKWK